MDTFSVSRHLDGVLSFPNAIDCVAEFLGVALRHPCHLLV